MTHETTNVPLTPSQIRFLMDMMVSCPLGATQTSSAIHKVDDADLYNHLDSYLK